MADYKAFNQEKYITTFGPPTAGHKVRGFGADDSTTIVFDSDFSELAKSVDGENRHVDLSDRSGLITVTLAAHSASNAAFTAFVAAGVPIPVTVTNKSTNGDVFFAGSVKIRTMPEMTGKDDRVWVWQFPKGTMTFAGAQL